MTASNTTSICTTYSELTARLGSSTVVAQSAMQRSGCGSIASPRSRGSFFQHPQTCVTAPCMHADLVLWLVLTSTCVGSTNAQLQDFGCCWQVLRRLLTCLGVCLCHTYVVDDVIFPTLVWSFKTAPLLRMRTGSASWLRRQCPHMSWEGRKPRQCPIRHDINSPNLTVRLLSKMSYHVKISRTDVSAEACAWSASASTLQRSSHARAS